MHNYAYLYSTSDVTAKIQLQLRQWMHIYLKNYHAKIHYNPM